METIWLKSPPTRWVPAIIIALLIICLSVSFSAAQSGTGSEIDSLLEESFQASGNGEDIDEMLGQGENPGKRYNPLDDLDRLPSQKKQLDLKKKRKVATKADEEMKDRCHCVFNLCLHVSRKTASSFRTRDGNYDHEAYMKYSRERDIAEKNFDKQWRRTEKMCHAWRAGQDDVVAKMNNEIKELQHELQEDLEIERKLIDERFAREREELAKRNREKQRLAKEERIVRKKRREEAKRKGLARCRQLWAAGRNPCDCSAHYNEMPEHMKNASVCGQ